MLKLDAFFENYCYLYFSGFFVIIDLYTLCSHFLKTEKTYLSHLQKEKKIEVNNEGQKFKTNLRL